MTSPRFVTVGHAVRDIAPAPDGGGWRLGGTVNFAAVQAARLGYSAGVVTRAAADFDVAALLPMATVVQKPSDATTSFENVYEDGARRQKVRAHGEAILIDDIPADWRAPDIALVGPVFGEAPADLCAAFAESALVGVSAQGWLRALDDDGNVVRAPYAGEPFWRGADAVFVSDEDLAGESAILGEWARDAGIVVMTKSRRGAEIFAEGTWRSMDAYPQDEVDPTGAGDTFATAFLIRLHETGDIAEAARFGAAAASVSIGGIGTAATPTREEIEERMRRYPEIALR